MASGITLKNNIDSEFTITHSDNLGAISATSKELASTKLINNIAELKLVNGSVTDKLEVLGYYEKGDGGGGLFYWDSTSTETDNGGTIIQATGITTGRWKRVYSGAVNVKWFGAKGDGITDDITFIQNAINNSNGKVFFPNGSYAISLPIYLDSEEGKSIQIEGESVEFTRIIKSAYGAGSGTNISPSSGAATDSYVRSAIIIVRHKDNKFNYNTSIKNMVLTASSWNEVGIYAPRVSHLILDTVRLSKCGVGFLTHDCWLSKFSMVEISCSGYGGANNTYGFKWEYDGVNNVGMGTSCTFQNTWVRDSDNGYYLRALRYSSFNSCAADHINKSSKTAIDCVPYYVYYSDITFNGCGMEDVNIPNANTGAIYSNGGNIVLNTCYSTSVTNSANGAMIRAEGTSSIVINSSEFSNFTSATGYNYLVQDGSIVSINSTNMPTNGNTYKGTLSSNSSISIDGRELYSSNGTDANNSIANRKISTIQDIEVNATGFSEVRYMGIKVPNGLGWNLAIDTSSSQDIGLLRKGTTSYYRMSTVSLSPFTDNTISCGAGSLRWSVIYSATGTINTSDDRLKTYLTIEEKEILVAKQLKKLIKKFKFNDSIEAKGKENARIHFGTSAQSVKKAFEDNGLDPFNYALLCYDEWKDEYEQILDKKEVLDNEGNIISEATYKNGKIINKSGNRYGIRYDELLCFIMSAL